MVVPVQRKAGYEAFHSSDKIYILVPVVRNCFRLTFVCKAGRIRNRIRIRLCKGNSGSDQKGPNPTGFGSTTLFLRYKNYCLKEKKKRYR